MTTAAFKCFVSTSGAHDLGERKAKKMEKACADCGVGVGNRRIVCGPCSDVRKNQNVTRYRRKIRAAAHV